MKKIIKKIIKIFLLINIIFISIAIITAIITEFSDNETKPEEKQVEKTETKPEEKTEAKQEEKKVEDIELNASIKATEDNIQITNDDSYDWINVRIRINDDYLLSVDRIESGRTFIVGWQQFIDRKSIRFNPYLEKATKVFIYSKLSDYERGSFLATSN